MVKNVIDEINKGLVKLFETVPNAKVYGLAQSLIKDGKFIPAIIDLTGKEQYAGVDDVHPVITYHKNNSITSTIKAREGYGDDAGSILNTYNNTLIVFLNRKRLKILPDELYLHIQAKFPDGFIMNPFSVVIKITNVILSSTQVWGSEYQRDFTLSPEANLFAVNYTIESTFKKGCFDKCLNV